MSYYVKIRKLNGRGDHADLASWLNSSGVGEVEYFEGGWIDDVLPVIAPHLKFEREEDALAYIITHGGKVILNIPEAKVGSDFLPGG